MTSDSRTLNDYGRLISLNLSKDLCGEQKPHLNEFFTALKGVFARLTHEQEDVSSQPPTETIVEVGTETILRSIDDIRFRMVGALLGSGALAARDGESAATVAIDTSLAKNIRTEPGGTSWMVLDRTAVILLPVTNQQSDANVLAGDLLNIYESRAKYDSWVFDCSAVKKFPLLLLAIIVGYRDSFGSPARGISFAWLEGAAIPPQIFTSISKYFSLTQIGDFYFSGNLRK